ncbi:flagellar export protein FliJ [Fundidesulfovibrio putealis]|uniref:flagellar export protein FliJ n=1 Tax=Fundidesulfovibrio putealis TaxID=270496 RepID=UPI00040400F5|nr:flagellar export protein FliJ [Fundidesulfovibrio putealis]
MPRPFRFNLQKVLDYRAQLEDQAKQALAKAEQAHQAGRARVEHIQSSLSAHLEAMSQGGAKSAADIWLGRNYAKRLAGDLYLAQQEEARLAQDVILRRQELVDRAKERKLLEKLKETQAERHARDENRKEQAEFDEMATLRYQVPAV